MTYLKAGLITLAALVFLGPFGFLVGGYVFWKAFKDQEQSVQPAARP
jgi:uncharacterized Tic20 family protein